MNSLPTFLIVLQLTVLVGAIRIRNKDAHSPVEVVEDFVKDVFTDHSEMGRHFDLCLDSFVTERSSKVWRTNTDADENLMNSVKGLCNNPEYRNMTDMWLVPGYEHQYEKIYGKKGWAEEAYVNYYADFKGKWGDARSLKMTEKMIESIERFSTKPVIVVNFGAQHPPHSWTRFQNLVVFRALPLVKGRSFNYNKFRAMIMAKVKTAVELDSDQFVTRAADRLFKRTAEECTQSYPYPILPVHWMSKDGDKNFAESPYSVYAYECEKCAERTMRWGHAHPTWTHWALPFIADLLQKHLDHGYVGDVPADTLGEDEDALNVGLWQVKANKQWCKWDIPSPALFRSYLDGDYDSLKGEQYQDSKWYPEGIPLMFYTAHDAKDPEQTMKYISQLQEAEPEKTIYFKGAFHTEKELQIMEPQMRCMT